MASKSKGAFKSPPTAFLKFSGLLVANLAAVSKSSPSVLAGIISTPFKVFLFQPVLDLDPLKDFQK